MKNYLFSVLLFLSFSAASYGTQIAFPGAEGYGKYATGGRGGIVVEVSNLNDSGTGSLRDALTGSKYKGKKRTIVFTVSGTIELQSTLQIKYDSYFTIAGQTAPGDGICLKNFSVKIEDSHDIIIRYIRFRPGDQQPLDTNQDVLDALDALSFRKCYSLMVDHCSLSWSMDDVLDLTVTTGFSTVQWSILSEPLNNSRHSKGSHGYIAGWDGSSFGGGIGFGGGSYHHNLLSSGGSRTPRLDKYADGTQRDLIDIVNNVIYNWDGYGAYGGESADVNWQNNYYKWGPNTSYGKRAIIFIPGDTCRMYVDGNYIDGNTKVTENNISGIKPDAKFTLAEIIQPIPFPVIGIDMQTPEEAYTTILAHGGAYSTTRDSCDSRIIKEVKDRKGDHIDSPTEVGGWPVLKSTTAPTDTDKDGMPDEWELFKGLDINSATDRNTVASDGYTMLEKYINAIELSRPIPDDMSLVQESSTSATIHWSDIYFQEQGFTVERAVNGGDFEHLADVSKDITSYTDNTITLTDVFTYRIKVKSNDWQTTYSKTLSTDALPKQVVAVAPLIDAKISSDTLQFSWSPSNGADIYTLYVGFDTLSMIKVADIFTTDYNYKLATTDTTYVWRVDATNSQGTTVGKTMRFSFLNTAMPSHINNNLEADIYPNPSADELQLSWTNPTNSNVSIAIYDITGVLITQLINRQFAAGKHQFMWDGMLENGTSLAHGIYLCVFKIENRQTVLKLNRII